MEHIMLLKSLKNWKTVFAGQIEQCLEYCWDRVIDYEESIIG